MASRPTGTVTFLFTDIEGSTRLLQHLGERMPGCFPEPPPADPRGDRQWGGYEVKTEGDAFFVVFPSALDAVRAAVEAQRALGAHAWPDGVLRVRMGVHTGEATLEGDDYVGLDIHRAARIAAAAHGGQVLVSDSVRQLTAGRQGPDTDPARPGRTRLRGHRPSRAPVSVGHRRPRADFPPIRSATARFEVLPPTSPRSSVADRRSNERGHCLPGLGC